MDNIGFDSIEALHQRKEQLLDDIRTSAKDIDTNWKSLFRADSSRSKNSKWVNIVNTGFGILDGLLLGWKLYRKFGKPFRGFGF